MDASYLQINVLIFDKLNIFIFAPIEYTLFKYGV